MQKKCTICGNIFESHYGREVCSEVCRLERKRIQDTNSNVRRRDRKSGTFIEKICPICGEKFETLRNKYCSQKCAKIARKKNLHIYNKHYYENNIKNKKDMGE